MERLILEDPGFPRENPRKNDRHEERNGDRTIDKDEGKNDVRSNTTDALDIDETNADNIRQTLSKCRWVGPVEVHGKGLVIEGAVGVFQNIECLGIYDLCRCQPVQEVQVEIVTVDAVRIYITGRRDTDLRLEDSQIPVGVPNVIPGAIDRPSGFIAASMVRDLTGPDPREVYTSEFPR